MMTVPRSILARCLNARRQSEGEYLLSVMMAMMSSPKSVSYYVSWVTSAKTEEELQAVPIYHVTMFTVKKLENHRTLGDVDNVLQSPLSSFVQFNFSREKDHMLRR